MGLFDKLKEPIFLKESSSAEAQIARLKELEPKLNPEGQALIRQDIKYLEYGMIGEKNIAYELKNSHMPMYILHDLYIEDGDLSAQIDYLVITRKICFVIECKNLYGDIEINNSGDFVRTIDFNGKKKKEGIYSPITQNQRHMDLIKKKKVESKSNPLLKLAADKWFDGSYKGIVVLANPKTVLNAKFAKKEVKEKILRADQLIQHIKDTYNQCKDSPLSDDKLLNWANSLLAYHKEIEKDYTKKYEAYHNRTEQKEAHNEVLSEAQSEVPVPVSVETLEIEETAIFKELKQFRLLRSRQENIKAYLIANDIQLKDLISKMPRNKEELLKVSGFGAGKVEKYGEEIIAIVGKYLG